MAWEDCTAITAECCGPFVVDMGYLPFLNVMLYVESNLLLWPLPLCYRSVHMICVTPEFRQARFCAVASMHHQVSSRVTSTVTLIASAAGNVLGYYEGYDKGIWSGCA